MEAVILLEPKMNYRGRKRVFLHYPKGATAEHHGPSSIHSWKNEYFISSIPTLKQMVY